MIECPKSCHADMVGCRHNASVPMVDEGRVRRTLKSTGSAIQDSVGTRD